jgi:hypothetical protein
MKLSFTQKIREILENECTLEEKKYELNHLGVKIGKLAESINEQMFYEVCRHDPNNAQYLLSGLKDGCQTGKEILLGQLAKSTRELSIKR